MAQYKSGLINWLIDWLRRLPEHDITQVAYEFGAENADFGWFRSFSFSTENGLC